MSKQAEKLALSDDGDGHWVTIDGEHVYIRNGKIEKGPANLVGKGAEVRVATDAMLAAAHRVNDESKTGPEKRKAISHAKDGPVGSPIRENGPYYIVSERTGNSVGYGLYKLEGSSPVKKGSYGGGEKYLNMATTRMNELAEKDKSSRKALSSDAILALSSDEARQLLTLGTALPKQINGEPVYYYRKEIARARNDGHYVHRGARLPDGTFNTFNITNARMDKWVDAFHKRKAAGIRPFMPHRHVGDDGKYIESEKDARANFGYIEDVERDGDSLYGIVQLIGDKARQVAAANDVSVYVTSDATDANGEHYDECIKHVCLTADPMIPHLKPFEPIAASADTPPRDVPVYVWSADLITEGVPEMDPKTIQQLRAKFGWGNEVPDDKIAEKVAERALALSGDIATLTTERDTLKTERDTLKTDLASAKTLAASADQTPLDPRSLRAINEGFRTQRAAVVASGVISEAGMKEIDKLFFKNSKPNHFALAASGDGEDQTFYGAICDILRKFPGIKTDNAVERGEPAHNPMGSVLAAGGDSEPAEPEVAKKAREQAEKYRDQQLAARGLK